MAQLVARLVRNEKVGGSNPPSSTEICSSLHRDRSYSGSRSVAIRIEVMVSRMWWLGRLPELRRSRSDMPRSTEQDPVIARPCASAALDLVI